jgi:hypothetical protein
MDQIRRKNNYKHPKDQKTLMDLVSAKTNITQGNKKQSKFKRLRGAEGTIKRRVPLHRSGGSSIGQARGKGRLQLPGNDAARSEVPQGAELGRNGRGV